MAGKPVLTDDQRRERDRGYQAKYRASGKAKASQRAYNSSPKGKATRRAAAKRYYARIYADPAKHAELKARHREWNHGEKARAKKDRYNEKILGDPMRLEARRVMQLRVRKRYVAKMRALDPKWEYNASRKRKLQKQYGLSPIEYATLLASHGNRCAICGGIDRLHVDHSHEDGHVRGILCGRCNPALGLLGDNIAGVEKALRYLQERC